MHIFKSAIQNSTKQPSSACQIACCCFDFTCCQSNVKHRQEFYGQEIAYNFQHQYYVISYCFVYVELKRYVLLHIYSHRRFVYVFEIVKFVGFALIRICFVYLVINLRVIRFDYLDLCRDSAIIRIYTMHIHPASVWIKYWQKFSTKTCVTMRYAHFNVQTLKECKKFIDFQKCLNVH